MPSVNVLEQKQKLVKDLSEKIQGSCAGVLVDYKGTTVSDDTALRAELREAGVNYAVIKNTMLHLAIKDTALSELDEVLTGTTALALSSDDYVAAARILSKFADKHKNFSIKGGFIDGEPISLDKLKSLGKLPSREILLASVVYAFQAPMAAFARAIQAVVDKDGSPEADEASESPQVKTDTQEQEA